MAEGIDPVLSYAFAKDHGVVVLGRDGAGVRLGLRAGADPLALIEARRAVRAPIRMEPLDPAAFDRRLSELYAATGLGGSALGADLPAADGLDQLIEGMAQTADLLDTDDDAPVIRLINGLIAQAVKLRASDIHVEPYENRVSIRLRVDGALHEILSQDRRLAAPLVSRVKVMARLDIAEKRLPQDGRISLTLGGRAIDVRVSTLPSRFGERVVMRLLDKEQALLGLDQLGMPAETDAAFRQVLTRPNGIVLVTGPTGSGKTTTLYAGLRLLNDGARNILTVEDPIEYGVEGVGQTQVNPKIGMTFAAGLRAILRQDPDVVMVGEIRDVETAQIAVQASLTGHLVFSTVHTNSAAAAVTRLRDMGVEPFLMASSLAAILAQRLVRRLCGACKAPADLTAAEREQLGLGPHEAHAVHRAVGCPGCGGLGYEGRVGIYELIVVDEPIRRMIHDGAREADIAAHAQALRPGLFQAGLAHVRAGNTTLEEVLRVVRQSGEGDGGV